LKKLAEIQAPKPARKKPHCPPAVYKPWSIVAPNIDTAANSGWSITVHSALVDVGEVKVKRFDDVVAICRRALELAADNDCECVLVLEKPPAFVYRRRGASVMLGLGAARKVWELAWKQAGGIAARIVRVEPGVWRKAVLGKARRGKNDPKNEIALLEKVRAVQLLQEAGLKTEQGPDAYVAVCLSFYAARAGEVGDVLPKRALERMGRR
jgi:hypothetical protein